MHVVSAGAEGTGRNDCVGPDSVVKLLFILFFFWSEFCNEAPGSLSQRAWAAQEQRQKAWEIMREALPKCVAILGPLFERNGGGGDLERSEKRRT